MIANPGNRGPWITAYPSGTRFYPESPDPEDVHIEDIAHSLAMQARFLGHTSRFYSVAEHSCHVGDWIYRLTSDPIAAACGLLHDGEESYVGDMPRPIKHYGPMRAYRSLCGRVSAAILLKFGLTEAYTKHEDLVKMTDDQLLHTESRRLNHKAEWEDEDKILTRDQLPFDQYAEQQVIGILQGVVDHPLRWTEPGVGQVELLRAIEILKDGGYHWRWRYELLGRFRTWIP